MEKMTSASTTPPVGDEYVGISFAQWTEQNADRIWQLLRAADRRDHSFNDLAEELWSQL